ncbi:acetylcholinesterase-like [Uranotaenia lowii]|uniref:acetylcholinesterase-like n=1 Tax=Uranotaenia lowii TaxID=190385 RepID=UPI0024793E83|nr:acetylcholinesterase-like [Uranotaenia lowii]
MASSTKQVITKLLAGKVKGVKATLPNGNAYYCYKGIPYAKPPVGELRFKPPVPLENFEEDILDCSYERNACPSLGPFPPSVAEGEDCLHVNVYTSLSPNQVDQTKLLPVMVWIYGGAFNCGNGDSSLYEPSYLVQEGVVAVTFNYRVGPLGFLCLPSAGIYGNMGLKDQRLILKWVNANIAKFGGDPNNVTIFGQSAGGASVHLQYLSEESRKYFHRAISQSGTAFNVWVEQRDYETKARKLAKLLGCTGTSDADVYQTLMTASALEICAQAGECMSMEDVSQLRLFAFTPVIEVEDSIEPFITEPYHTLLKQPKTADIPIIYGVTSNEALTFVLLLLPLVELFLDGTDPKIYVPPQLPVPDSLRTEVGEMVQNFYLKNQKPSKQNIQPLLDFISDVMFVIPAFVASELHARYRKRVPQYFFLSSFEGTLDWEAFPYPFPNKPAGACHGADCDYIFQHRYQAVDEDQVDDRARKFRATVCQLWTNFAKYGKPLLSDDGSLAFMWEPVEPLKSNGDEFPLQALELGDSIRMVQQPMGERLKFWKQLFTKYGGQFLEHRSLM